MSSISTPISFSPNTLIKSADVNTNFTAINTVVNGNLDNTNIASGAAIAVNKLAALTASRIVSSDGSGFLTTQTNAATMSQISPITTTGDMIYSSSGTTNSRLAIGSANQVLKSVNGVPTWSTFSNNGINYIASNPDAEVDTAGWATYADAAQNTPVNGTAGSANITWTRTTSTPLRGTGSFLYTRTAANRQGEGVSFDFTIDQADRSQPLSISFDYSVASGTFVAADGITAPLNDGTTSQNAGMSDLEVFMYDVTNSVLIPVTPQVLTSTSTTSANFKGRFQAASNSSSYRLILHTARSTAVAFTMEFDNFFVGPQAVNYGAAMSDWSTTDRTFTITGFGTVANQTVSSRRSGDMLEVTGSFTCGTPTAVTATINLAGLSIDTTKMGAVSQRIGEVDRLLNAANSFPGTSTGPYPVIYDGSTATTVFLGNQASGYAYTKQLGNDKFSASENVKFWFRVPISGWSSNVQMSNDTETRVTAALATGNPASTTSGNVIILPTVSFDTHGAYNASTGRYTVPVSGIWEVSQQMAGATGGVNITIYKNAASTLRIGCTQLTNLNAAGSGLVRCVAGDILDIRPDGTIDPDGNSWVAFKLLTGPSAIASTEKVFLQYTGNAGTAITAGVTNLDWSTKVVDSHSAWSGTTFTAPRAGMYRFTGIVRATADVNWVLSAYKNTVLTLTVTYANPTNSRKSFSGEIYLVAGDALTFRSDTNFTESNSATDHWISISSQG
jgi:hypothetical protein